MRSRLTSFLSRSATVSTALTAISANLFWSLLTTLDPKETQAASTNSEYCSLSNLISSLSSSSLLTAIYTAISNPSDILRGCNPESVHYYLCPAFFLPAPAEHLPIQQYRSFRLQPHYPDFWIAQPSTWQQGAESPSSQQWWPHRW